MNSLKFRVVRYDFDVEETYLVLHSDGKIVTHEVQSPNVKVRNHLDRILQEPITTIYPVALKPSVKNRALVLAPNQLQFFFFACDRLSWYGYRVEPRAMPVYDQVAKSLFAPSLNPFRDLMVTKSAGGDLGQYIKPSRSHPGHRIVERVPPGYIAVHVSGKILGPNHWLNADIDKEGAEWTLQPQQQGRVDTTHAEGRAQGRRLAMMRGVYHPGIHEELYGDDASEEGSKNLGDDEQVPVSRGFTPSGPFADKLRTWFAQQPKLNEQVAAQAGPDRATVDPVEAAAPLDAPAPVGGIDLGGNQPKAPVFGNDQARRIAMGYGGTPAAPSAPNGTQGNTRPDFGAVNFDNSVALYSAKLKRVVMGSRFNAASAGNADDWHVIDMSDVQGKSPEEVAQLQSEFQAQNPGARLPARFIPGLGQRGLVTTHNYANYDYSGTPFTLPKAAPTPLTPGRKTPSQQQAYEANAIKVGTVNTSDPRERARVQMANMRHAQRKAKFMRDVITEDGRKLGVSDSDAIRAELLGPRFKDLMGYDKGKERFYRSFDGRPYQALAVQHLSDAAQYGRLKGPQESDGVFVNYTYGLGKTPIIAAADAAMRNHHGIEGIHVVVCPNILTTNWANEMQESRREQAVIVEGTVEQRQKIWADIADRVNRGQAPKFVVVAAGKFRQTASGETKAEDETEDEKLTSSLDVQALKVLSVGGKMTHGDRTIEVAPRTVAHPDGSSRTMGHVAFTTIDETSLFMNPDSKRHLAMKDLIQHTTAGGSVVWALNGDISGNSSADVITNLSLVNRDIRENYNRTVQEYTIPVNPTQSGGRRIFDAREGRLTEFMKRYNYQFSSMTGQSAMGEYNLQHTEHHHGKVGEEYGAVYKGVLNRMMKARELIQAKATRSEDLARYFMAHITLLRQASENVADPRTLTEYDLHSVGGYVARDLHEHFSRVHGFLPRTATPQQHAEREAKVRASVQGVLGKMQDYQNQICDEIHGLICPRPEFNMADRQKTWERVMGDDAALLNDMVARGWHNPTADHVMNDLLGHINSGSAGPRLRLGFASMSRRFVDILHARIQADPRFKNKAGTALVRVNMFNGDTKPDDVAAQQRAHQAMNAHEVQQERAKHPERDKYARLSDKDFAKQVLHRDLVTGTDDVPVLSMVTAAGTFGLNLPAVRVLRHATWNPGRGKQLEARYHRGPTQYCKATKIVAPGIGELVNEAEETKAKSAELMSNMFSGDLDFTGDDTREMPLPQDPEKVEAFMTRLLDKHPAFLAAVEANPRRTK